jgi:ABC-2 type transport system permease protein
MRRAWNSVERGNGLAEVTPDLQLIGLFLVVILTIGIKRYRQTLD